MTSPSVVLTTTRSPPAGGVARHDQAIAVTVKRHHGIAGDLKGEDIVADGGGKIDLVPAAAGRESGVVEEAAGAGLGEAKQRHRAVRRLAPGGGCGKPEEDGNVGAGRHQDLGDAFGRRPTRAPVGGDPLGLVEGGRIEPGQARQPGRLRRLRSASRSIADEMRAWDNTLYSLSVPSGARS